MPYAKAYAHRAFFFIGNASEGAGAARRKGRGGVPARRRGRDGLGAAKCTATLHGVTAGR